MELKIKPKINNQTLVLLVHKQLSTVNVPKCHDQTKYYTIIIADTYT